MKTEPEKKPLTKEQVAKAMTKEIYIASVRRVVELAEKMQPPPDQAAIKKMLLRRFQISVDAAEIFIEMWPQMGKGRFSPKED